MVIFDLRCDSKHEFEGWFESSQDLTTQQEQGILLCPVCDSSKVTKKLAAPNIFKKSTSRQSVSSVQESNNSTVNGTVSGANEAYSKVQGLLAKVNEFVNANFEDVGNNFADEALKMHKGDKEPVSIRGTASNEQLKDLAEEGVKALVLPPKPIDKKKLN